MFYLKNVILELGQGEPIRKKMTEDAREGEATLWITDDEARARQHVREGRPVMGLLHDGNADQRFEGIAYLVSDLAEVEPEYFEKVYRRFAGIPWDVLETERCLVRETTADDEDAFYGIYAEPSVTAYLEDLPGDRDAFRAWLSDYAKNVYGYLGYGIWTVCLKGSLDVRNAAPAGAEGPKEAAGQEDKKEAAGPVVIGRAGLQMREGFDQPELGFVIGKKWQGLGLAREVCSAILEYARELGIPEVIAFAWPENEASAGLLRRLGFQEDGEAVLEGKISRKFSLCLTGGEGGKAPCDK